MKETLGVTDEGPAAPLVWQPLFYLPYGGEVEVVRTLSVSRASRPGAEWWLDTGIY